MLTYKFQNIQNLWFYLFEDSSIPSTVKILKQRCLSRKNYELNLRIIGSSHIISFKTNSSQLTECLTCQPIEDIKTKALIACPISLNGGDFVKKIGDIKYTIEYQTELLEYSEYRKQHLLLSKKKDDTLSYEFPVYRDTVEFYPITLLDYFCQANIVQIWTYHTYPNEFGIVYTHTKIEIG